MRACSNCDFAAIWISVLIIIVDTILLLPPPSLQGLVGLCIIFFLKNDVGRTLCRDHCPLSPEAKIWGGKDLSLLPLGLAVGVISGSRIFKLFIFLLFSKHTPTPVACLPNMSAVSLLEERNPVNLGVGLYFIVLLYKYKHKTLSKLIMLYTAFCTYMLSFKREKKDET